MGKLTAALAALRYGSALTDPAIWKRRQNLMNALVGLLGAAAVFLPVEVSDADMAAIVGGIVAVVGLFNAWATTATTDKIGLPPRRSAADQHGGCAGGHRHNEPRIEP